MPSHILQGLVEHLQTGTVFENPAGGSQPRLQSRQPACDSFLKFWVNSSSLDSKIDFHLKDLRPNSAHSVANIFGSAGWKGKTG